MLHAAQQAGFTQKFAEHDLLLRCVRMKHLERRTSPVKRGFVDAGAGTAAQPLPNSDASEKLLACVLDRPWVGHQRAVASAKWSFS